MLPRPIAELLPPEISPGGDDGPARVAEWLCSPAALRHREVRRYLAFLKLMYETYCAIYEGYLRMGREPHGSPKGAETSPHEMLYLANHLYALAAEGVPGVALECGTYKGYSACCLSHACGSLGRKLVLADSFQGLPGTEVAGEEHYARGDFRGTLEEVRDNLEAHGRPEVVELLEGYFETSLAGWNRPVGLLWMDVDLFSSTWTVLERIYPHLVPGAAIFCHEFLPEYVRRGVVVHDREPPGALAKFLRERGREHSAAFLTGNLGVVSFADTVTRDAHRLVEALIPDLRDRDHRVRAFLAATPQAPSRKDALMRRFGLGRRSGS